MRTIPDGDITGLSLSFCVKDIIEGRVELGRVVCIYTGTMATSEEHWDRLADHYCQHYWRKDPDRARQILTYLREQCMIVQPRVSGREPENISTGHWRPAR